MQSAKERESKKVMEEIQELLSKPSAKEQSIVEKFKSQGGKLSLLISHRWVSVRKT